MMSHYIGESVVLKMTNERARIERIFKTSAFGPALLVVRLATRRPDGDPFAIVEEKELRA